MKGSIVLRLASAAILGPAVVGLIYLGGWPYRLLLAAGAAIALWEWMNLCRRPQQAGNALPGVVWLVLGGLYVLAATAWLVWLREDGMIIVLWLFLVVWATDSVAWLAGITIGGPKLAPRISPKKTWSGLAGGLAGAGATGYAVATATGGEHAIGPVILLSVLVGAISQLGDLLESWAKRTHGVKDTGALIPGHGGILDRIDGLLAASLFVGVVRMVDPGDIGPWL